jgi:hypothetical protein
MPDLLITLADSIEKGKSVVRMVLEGDLWLLPWTTAHYSNSLPPFFT